MITDFSCWVDVDIARFQKYKKNKKNQNLQKKEEKRRKGKVEGLIWKPSKTLPINTMLYWIFKRRGVILKEKKQKNKRGKPNPKPKKPKHSRPPPPFAFDFSTPAATPKTAAPRLETFFPTQPVDYPSLTSPHYLTAGQNLFSRPQHHLSQRRPSSLSLPFRVSSISPA